MAREHDAETKRADEFWRNMNINKDRTAIYTKMCAGLLVMVLEDILHAEDCVDFKLGVAKAGQ